MFYRKLIFTLFLLLLAAAGNSVFCSSSKDSLLRVLESELKNKSYDRQKETKLNRIKASLAHSASHSYERKYHLYNLIFEEYLPYQFDSSYVYLKKMIEASEEDHDSFRIQESQLKLLHILTTAGLFTEARELLTSLSEEKILPELKGTYYDHKARFFENLANYINDGFYAAKYRKESELNFRKMSKASPPNTFERVLNQAEFGYDKAKSKKPAADFYLQYITHSGLTKHGIAMAAMRLSHHYSGDDKIALLSLSAINDIKASTKHTQAILRLGEELYKAGDLKMAYECINKAVSDAAFYNARSHKIDIQNILPMIAGKTIMETERQRDKSIIYSLIFAIIGLIAVAIIIIVYLQLKKIKENERLIQKQNQQLAAINSSLMEHTRINEEYIGFFFKKSFSYISLLEKLKRTVERKIKMKKFEDALESISSLQINREREELYNTLDQIFLKLLPDFIPAFNKLLKPEDQIWPQKEESLNPVLRIFALIRLGIKDDETIAGILDYSISTIYTYKMRIKAKSIIKGEEFDKRIMDIKFIDH
ncbi:DUF6377 domain-containing protein [Desertivirga arenae]|uniref:DUF6377 domain-containing protein n=1 Tax=Desertivirga arenae TaxID=2810309 RepID=UPI001A975017|nr:DUF6377 domain-containing protein [Pedobacter sp. SYSU D00823]